VLKEARTLLVVTMLMLGGVLIANPAIAQPAPAPPAPEPAADADKKGTWDQFGMGAGLSFTYDTGEDDRVESAEIVDGIVRVTDEENGIPRIVLESHYFMGDQDSAVLHGPFVAIQPGDDDIINSIALGYMVGLARKGADRDKTWNIGVAIAADPNVQVLGDGLKPDRALPGNETEIRFKEETQYGIMVVFSRGWQM
jgi:hypothetical protein